MIFYKRNNYKISHRSHKAPSQRLDSTADEDVGLWRYLKSEVTGGYVVEEEEETTRSERQKRMDTFIQAPKQLEKLFFYGFLMCCNAFLFVYTFLPIRLVVGLFQLLLCCKFPLRQPSYVCDVLKAILLITGTFVIQHIDTSVIYHLVRGQSVLKLYVIFNMLDVFERLLTSVGKDTLDSLYWLAVEKFCHTEERRRNGHFLSLCVRFIMANAYIVLHCIVGLFQAATLNVAINSHNKAFLTIMVSNQFVELKGSVFKKCGVDNLFQLSCSDIRERFSNVILVLIVSVRNLAQFNWNLDYLGELFPDILLILGSEILVDWVKHAFILKFNTIEPEVYTHYLGILFTDIETSRQKKTNSDSLSGKLGFIPLPFACLVLQTVQQNVKLDNLFNWLLLLAAFLIMLALKVILGYALLRKAHAVAMEKATKMDDRSGDFPSTPHSTMTPEQMHLLSQISKTTLKTVPIK